MNIEPADLLRDLRFGFRQLLRNPGFTAVSVCTLALGIGATAAIFSVVDAVLLRPLPYPDPDRLAIVWEKPPNFDHNSVSVATYLDWREKNDVFEIMAARVGQSVILTGGREPEQLAGAAVSPGYLELLGVQAAVGRTFLAEEEQPDRSAVAILSYGLWQRRFGGSPEAVGSSIRVSDKDFRVVGVLSADAALDRSGTQLYVPLAVDPSQASRSSHFLTVYARLKPTASLAQARASMENLAAGIAREHPETNKGWGVRIDSLRDSIIGSDLRLTLVALFASVFLILLIACVNVANLSLARAADRTREVSLRAALGAGRGRLLSQFLSESLILALAGGVLGMLLAMVLVDLLVSWMPSGTLPAQTEVTVDLRLIGFSLGVSLLTSILFGIAPAWRASRQDPQPALREAGRGTSAGLGRRRVGSLLVVAEASLALILLVGAGLAMRSLWSLRGIDLGFDPSRLLTLHLSLPSAKYPDSASTARFFEQVLSSSGSLPGVQDAAVALDLPLTGWSYGVFFLVEGTAIDPSRRPAAHLQSVSAGYFRTLGIPIREGREFDLRDRAGSPGVCIVNSTLAARQFSGDSPLGRRIRLNAGQQERLCEVVGVSQDVRVYGLDPEAVLDNPEIYVPMTQASLSGFYLALRTSGDPLKVAHAVEERIHAIDPDQPVTGLRSMEGIVSQTLSDERFLTLLLGGFAATALLLAAVGIYSVVSCTVAGLTRQIGIRRALGAADRDLMGLIVRRAMVPVLVGILFGVGASAAMGGLVERLLYGVVSSDPLTLTIAPCLLALVAFFAAYVPGRRARKVDPLAALRAQ